MKQQQPYVFVFGNKWNAAERVAALGYTPVVFHHDVVAVEHFAHLTKKQASACQYDRDFVEQFPIAEVVGLVVTSDYYVELAAHLRTEYFPLLPGLTSWQAALVRNKVLLKRTLQQIDIPCTRFTPLTANYPSMRNLLGESFLIKPRCGAMTEGIEKISSPLEWQDWTAAHADPENYYGEEYLANVREYCCDTIVANGKVLVQFPGEYSTDCLNFRRQQCGVGVDYPGFVSPNDIEALKTYTRQFIAHSQIPNGFFHAEFFYTAEGGKFSEVGCRLPGALQLPTESAMAGIELLDLYLRIFITTEPTPTTLIDLTNRYYGYYLYPITTGRISTIDIQFQQPWIVEGKVYHQVGDFVTTDMSNFFAGHVVYHARSIDELRVRSQQVPHLLRVTSGRTAGE